MKVLNLIKCIFLFLLNFILFSLPFLIVILENYNMFNCEFYVLNPCKSIYNFYGLNIVFLLFFLGILISIFAFLSNFLEKRIASYFSVSYSVFVLIFLIFVFNFGKFEINFGNEAQIPINFNKTKISVDFKIPFYILVLSSVVDIIRRIVVNFVFKS
ncbi:MAG: hypothetical protein QXL97_02610 [Candidatus Aenigmatarchaeota archaeon]